MSSKQSPLSAPISDFTREQYTYYLQDQLEKLSSFMLYQKKQNEKHNLMNRIIQEQNQKIKFLNDRVLIVELYQNQNLKNQQKLFQSTQKAIRIEKRVEQIENFVFEQRSRTNPNKNTYGSSLVDTNMKMDIMMEIDEKMKNIHEDLYGEMEKLQKHFMKKLKKLNQVQEISQIQNFTFKEPKKRVISKDIMSPLQTNYSQNGHSRLKQLQRLGEIDKKQMKRMQKRINSIIDQKISKFQNQLHQMHDNECPSSSKFSSMQQSQLIQDQERSPISTYLKRQNDYKSNKQNINSTNRYPTSKSFYSTCDKNHTKKTPQIQMKSKSKSKSRSKSQRSKSNRSVSKNRSFDEIVDKKLNNALKIAKGQQKSIKNPNYTQQKADKKQMSFLKKKKISQRKNDSKLSLNRRDANKCCKKGQKRIEKNRTNKRSVSKSVSKHSHLSISQASDISRSRSRSQTKLDRNQKQYMMYCDKMH